MPARLSRHLALSLLTLLTLLVAPLSAGARSISDQHERAQSPASAQARPFRVTLQIGHYKNNELPPQLSSLVGHTGAVGGGRTELELNIDAANRLAAALRKGGVVVEVLPSTVPTGHTADAFIALHADGSSSSAARGFKISTRWRSEVAVLDATLMETLTASYRAATGLPEDSGVTRNMRGYYAYSPWRPNYRVSNFTPSAIVEMGFVTSAADRAVMYNQTDKVVAGIADGVMRFLRATYGNNAAPRGFGYGIVDDDIDPTATSDRRPGTSSSPPSPISKGDWQVLLMGKATIPVYGKAGGGAVITTLPRGQFHHSTLRNGDYYRITLPDGREGWLHRNAVITQM